MNLFSPKAAANTAVNHVLIGLVMLLAGCAGSDVGQFGPYNVSASGADQRLMLNGYDPVAYHSVGRHILGESTIKAEFDGVTYRFANEANKIEFQKDPGRYLPQFGGFCANGIAYAIPWGGDGDAWQLIDGKLFIFGGQASKKYFLMEQTTNRKLANDYWHAEVKGRNAFIQRYKRLVLRVPHYRTGAELEQAWERAQPPGSN